MLGSLLAGADEAPLGQSYFGQASEKSAAYTGKYVEGDLKEVPATGPVADTIRQLMDGVRSGISYSGGQDIKGLQENAEFIVVR
jgi:IMP dehydrogenase/GMP reductase